MNEDSWDRLLKIRTSGGMIQARIGTNILMSHALFSIGKAWKQWRDRKEKHGS